LGREAEAITEDIHEHERAIVSLQSRLLGYDRMTADFPGSMPGNVRDYLFVTLRGRVATPAETRPWADACAVLRADADAEISIEQPVVEPTAVIPVIIAPVVQAARALQAQAAREAAEREAEAAQVVAEETTEQPPAAA
jgi:hypothetical protein